MNSYGILGRMEFNGKTESFIDEIFLLFGLRDNGKTK